ncbi:hypothetical protein [Geobacter pickeringii]|uniref:Tetratricopeptide repeat protein n=1 Tax=Geobacter pickeringii TaxID=345632 RepID=A0A0B5BD14_9BACT|nr:hypothetical protein [Geobacter pickeringii]AJE04357.1 hypothetical protein GPICK_14245 [Geobacter pickeringii]
MVNNATTRGRTVLLRSVMTLVFALFVVSFAWGGEPNRLYRIDIRQRSGFTRLGLKLDRQPEYVVTSLSGNRVRVTLRETSGRRWKRLRSYADSHVAGVTVGRRGGDLLVTVAVKGNPLGVRVLSPDDSDVLTIDVGDALVPRRRSPLAEGREGIRAGVEQLLTRFDPPLRSDIPFTPTDRRQLEKVIPPDLVAQVLAGEAALYQGQGGAAEEVFAPLAARETPVRGLALFRLGEARYMLQKYGEALKEFREGERVYPDFLRISPATTFAYADSVARSGDLEGGRRMMARLIAGLADKGYAPMLLVRLADILARQGRELHAEAIYRAVAENFTGSKALWRARMKLADRRLVTMDPATFDSLVTEYLDIYQNGGDYGLREEGLFKGALLMSLYGDAAAAFDLLREYGRKFPRGVYGSIVRGMREELLVPLWRGIVRDKDDEGLIRLAQENKEYLARCLADPAFVKRLSDAFAAGERTRDEATLFAWLVDKEWSGGSAPELYRRLIDDAQRLADLPLFEKATADFLRRFPAHPAALSFREQLAAQEYHRGEMPKVVARLSGFLGGKQRPESVESLYYLGKALDGTGSHKDAERAMTLFLSENRQRGGGGELVPDAYYVVAAARLARGDRAGAMSYLQAGSEAAPAGGKAPFLYKMGEVARSAGRSDEAVRYLKSVAAETKDPEWQKMASQALADIELQRSLAGKVRLSK